MSTRYRKVVWTMSLMGMSAVALAGEPTPKPVRPQEPVGFVTGAIVGAFAGGPLGAVVGAGIGTWLGNRVHRAAEASKAEAQVADLKSQSEQLKDANAALKTEESGLLASNQALTARLGDLSQKVETAQHISEGASETLDGLQGDVLFRTGSAEISSDVAHQVQVIAQAVARAPELKVRIDGYADPRGADDFNMALSKERADAVRDLLMAAGVGEEALEVNAYGKTQSVAADNDGYALERRVRLTLRMAEGTAVAQVQKTE